MGIHRGSNIIRSSLEFAYDTGYSSTFDNSSNYLHNKGEPTTNLYTNSDFSNGETGWTFGSWSNNAVTHTATTVTGPHGKQVSANKLYMGVNGGAVHFHQYNGSKYTSGNTYTTSAWVKGQGTFQIKSHWGGNTSFTMTGDWQRVSMTVTATTSTNGNFPYFAGEGLTVGSTFYITDTQTELGSHATPYIYSSSSNGTRSATNSLIDLTRQSTIDLANVSFDSNAHMTFDGTDDKGEVSNFPAIWNGSVSLEAVASWDDDSRSIIFGNYNCNNNDINFEKLTGGALRFYWGRGARDVSTTGNPRVTTSGDYHHVAFVRDTSANNFRFYVDGTLVTTVSNAGSNITSTGSTFRIGGDTRNGSTIHNGNIPIIRVYSKALTTEEVTQNFIAYRDRFNM